jgi:hypothetical protein
MDSGPAPRGASRNDENKEKGRPVCTERPFLSYGSSTLTGDFRTSAPGAYLPAVSFLGCRCKSGQSRLRPEPSRWFPTSVRCAIEPRSCRGGKNAGKSIPAVNRRQREIRQYLRRVGKAKGSRERAPDGVPTTNIHHAFKIRWWARRESAFAHPTMSRCFSSESPLWQTAPSH